jgi:hypothetical protein
VLGLVAYTTLLLAGAGAIQFLRGWRRLLVILGFGGFAVMGLAVGGADNADVVEVAVVTIGVLAALALFGVLPLFRAHLRRLDPATWVDPAIEGWWGKVAPPEQLGMALLRVGCFLSVVFAVVELGGLFDVESRGYAAIAALGCLAYLALSRGLFETRLAFNVAAETAAILLVMAIWIGLADYRVMLPLAVAAAAMHLANARWGLPGVAVIGHLVFALLLIFIIARTDGLGFAAPRSFGVEEWAALGAIALALTTSLVLQAPSAKQVYRVAAHVAFLTWLAIQFSPMQYGQELISVSWGVYGIGLFLLSLRMGHKGIQMAALVTLGIVAAKLLLVDMAQVDVIWRILLFMGFGAAFLGMSYLIKRDAKTSV